MTTESAENNYHIPSGASQMPDKLSLADITPGGDSDSSADRTDAAADSGATNSTDDMLRQGIYSQQDTTTTVRSDATDFNVGRATAPSNFERFDQTQLATVMKEFGDLTLIEGSDGAPSEGSVNTALRAHEASFEVAAANEADGGQDDMADAPDDRDTQEAFARLATLTPKDSQIMDRLHQTWDRLREKDNVMSA